jgi:polysaccharide export outer membrane protein
VSNLILHSLVTKRTNIIIYLAILLLFSSCATVVKNRTTVDPARTQTRPYLQQEYRIHVGDLLSIKFFYNPELNEDVTVRPDGRISLQLVQEIMVVDMTPAKLTDVLTKKYATELKKPVVTVIVRSFGAQKVYVDGEINRAGILDLIGPMTVLQSISLAGGLKASARINEVIVIRRGTDKKPLVTTLNVGKVIDGTDMSQDIFLMPLDIVYVPKSPIANINQWVDQYIRKNIPVPFSFGYTIY